MLISELRKQLNYTQKELAEAIGATEASIRNWEKADYPVTGAKIRPVFQRKLEKLAKKSLN